MSTSHPPIVLHVSAADLDQDVETTAHYVAAEAITNAVKHAGATTITLDVDTVAGQLHVRVNRRRQRARRTASGSGLAGLADRVDAHGGQLLIESQNGSGTTVEAVLPCVS